MHGAEDLRSLSEYVYGRTKARLAGLTDDEHLWEPVALAWSVRRRPDGSVRADEGSWPDDPPMTTIAWRLWHLTGCYGADRNERWLLDDTDWGEAERCAPRLDAAGAVAALDAAAAWWGELLATLDDEVLGQPLGPRSGPYAEHDKGSFVLHQIDEQIHHGAEIGVLRDLYRDMVAAPADPALAALARGERPADTDLDRLRAERPDLVRWAAANGHWRALPLLVEAGFDLEASAAGATALHHAASAGELDVVRLLVEHGADRKVRDDFFRSTPLGWAVHFSRDDVTAYLRAARTADEHDDT